MIEAFWIPLLPPYLIGLVLSFLVETMLTPRPVAPWQRPLAAVGVHVGVWTVAFALELMLFRRPYFAVANVLAIELVIVLVSNAKYQALREPFVYPDFEYFTDAIKHPRLYLPFFGVGRALAAGGGYGVALWAGLALEDSVTAGAGIWLVSFAELPQEGMFDPTAPMVPFYGCAAALAAAGYLAAVAAGRHVLVSFDASEDLARSGLVASLWAYHLAEDKPTASALEAAPFNAAVAPRFPENNKRDLIVIQSESFFDPRRTYPLVRRDVLTSFDQLKSEAIQHGKLRVAAWGANTVRTEFAFLSGVSASKLGVHRYNPYRRLINSGFPTIASHFRERGYRTICVHPYFKTFYRRDKVFPGLGFDEFIDIGDFVDSDLDGAYIGDLALADKVIERLRQASGQPVYLHVISMENHGPLHWESVDDQAISAGLSGSMPQGCEDLIVYLRHLRNADAMFGKLREALLSRTRPSTLCIFGDHVPIMPRVYNGLGFTDGATDYAIWRSDQVGGGDEMPMAVEDLALACLHEPAFTQKRDDALPLR